MNMDGDIRVRIERAYDGLYGDLKRTAVGDFHEVFYLCASLGYSRGLRTPLGAAKEEKFWSKTITPDEWACYYAMVLRDASFEFACIEDDQAVLQVAQEYANAGIALFVDELLSSILLPSTSEPRLDTSQASELPKLVLAYVLEQSRTLTGEPA